MEQKAKVTVELSDRPPLVPHLNGAFDKSEIGPARKTFISTFKYVMKEYDGAHHMHGKLKDK